MQKWIKITICIVVILIIVAVGSYLTHNYEYSRFDHAMESVQLKAIRITNITIIESNVTGGLINLYSEAEIRVYNPTQYSFEMSLFDLEFIFPTPMGLWGWPQSQISWVLVMPNSTAIVHTYWGGYGTSYELGSYIYSYLSNMSGIWHDLSSMGITMHTKASFKTIFFETMKQFDPDTLVFFRYPIILP